MSKSKVLRRKRIRYRIRNKLLGTLARPRLSVYRSNRYIYCQLIDDNNGHTLARASSVEDSVSGKSKIEQAKEVGKLIAERASGIQIDQVLFDRGGYLYHGRVKSLAEGAREAGLKF